MRNAPSAPPPTRSPQPHSTRTPPPATSQTSAIRSWAAGPSACSPVEKRNDMEAQALHRDAVVADTHNDLILLVDHFDKRGQRTHFADFWLPELRAGGVDVQVLPICLEEQFQSEGGLRRTLRLVERIHRLVEEHSDNLALCLTGADVDAATAAKKIACIIALEGAHGIGQDPQ